MIAAKEFVTGDIIRVDAVFLVSHPVVTACRSGR
jgi:hypothetical protein